LNIRTLINCHARLQDMISLEEKLNHQIPTKLSLVEIHQIQTKFSVRAKQRKGRLPFR